MPEIDLKPESLRFAEGLVAAGRYQTFEEVFDAALRLLQRQEKLRAALVASLDAARDEAERVGWLDIEQVDAELTAIIEKAEAKRANDGEATA